MLETNIIPFDPAQPKQGTLEHGEALAQLENIILNRGDRRVLDCLDLEIRSGGITALLGANGAGKSLSLKLIAGLLAADSGSVRHCGLALKQIGIMFQHPVLLRRSVEGNLCHALKTYGIPRAERADLITNYLELADLTSCEKRPARRLSGGEQQRLSLVRAIAPSPKLLLLDEPTTSLDPRSAIAVERLIQTASDDGIKIVLVTHDRAQAQRLASEVCFLHQGRLTEQTATSDFFAGPQSAEAIAYLEGRLLA